MNRFILAACVLLLAANPRSCGRKASEVPAGEAFILGVGECAYIEGEKVAVCFEKITADSRCPTGVNCVWAGEVSGEFSVFEKNAKVKDLILTLGAESRQKAVGVVGRWQYKFLEAEPYPAEDLPIEPKEYTVELIVNLAPVE